MKIRYLLETLDATAEFDTENDVNEAYSLLEHADTRHKREVCQLKEQIGQLSIAAQTWNVSIIGGFGGSASFSSKEAAESWVHHLYACTPDLSATISEKGNNTRHLFQDGEWRTVTG